MEEKAVIGNSTCQERSCLLQPFVTTLVRSHDSVLTVAFCEHLCCSNSGNFENVGVYLVSQKGRCDRNYVVIATYWTLIAQISCKLHNFSNL
jgi:hypothetical protein